MESKNKSKKEGIITLPVGLGNFLLAKAEALDNLLEKELISKELILDSAEKEEWYVGILRNNWNNKATYRDYLERNI
ncbi:TPA: hypothetical protein ACGPA6_002007 [Streptococcus suis]|nr:hypothetical protein [Streptococcus suis]